jgi:uncharacterized protein (DUF2147 family)
MPARPSRLLALVLFVPLVLLACERPAPGVEGSIDGRWITATGNLEIDIAPCGAELCGKVARVLANRSMARAGKEMSTPPPALGLQILGGLAPSGPGEWTGRIYDREKDTTYRCHVTRVAPDALDVRGYVGIPLLGRSQTWRRVAELPAGG